MRYCLRSGLMTQTSDTISNQVWAQEVWQLTVKERDPLAKLQRGLGTPQSWRGDRKQRGQQPGAREQQGSLGYVTCNKTRVQFSQAKGVCTEPWLQRVSFHWKCLWLTQEYFWLPWKGSWHGTGNLSMEKQPLIKARRDSACCILRNRIVSSTFWSCSLLEQGFGSLRSPCSNSIPLKRTPPHLSCSRTTGWSCPCRGTTAASPSTTRAPSLNIISPILDAEGLVNQLSPCLTRRWFCRWKMIVGTEKWRPLWLHRDSCVTASLREKKTMTGSGTRHWATIRGLEWESCGGARGEDSEIWQGWPPALCNAMVWLTKLRGQGRDSKGTSRWDV